MDILDHLNVWTFLAGLGFFLFGMELLETSLKNMAGRTFRDFLKRNTKSAPRAIFSGAFVTAILQSSTLVSLMTLAFVGAGLLKMSNAIGVILGTNLGTTATGWIFALVGFKLNILSFAYMLLGVGSLLRLLLNDDSEIAWHRILYQVAQFMLGFALLFIGIENMKLAIGDLSDNVDLSLYRDWPVISFVLIGFLLTALIQSSTATMAITLSALSAGVLSLNHSAAIIIGAYIGTTLTVLLGAIGADSDRKRVAISHFLFNLTTSTVAFITLPFLVHMVKNIFKIRDPLISLVTIHSSISILGILIFLPIIKQFANLLHRIIPDREEFYGRYISGLTPTIHGPVIEALEKEILELYQRIQWFNYQALKIQKSPKKLEHNKSEIAGRMEEKSKLNSSYGAIKAHGAEIYDFAYTLLESPSVQESEVYRIQELIASARFLLSSAKSIKNIGHNIEEINSSEDKILKKNLDQWTEDFHLYSQELSTLLDSYGLDQEKASKEFITSQAAKIKAIEDELKGAESKWNTSFQESYHGKSFKKSEIPTMFNISREIQLSLEHTIHAIRLWSTQLTDNIVEDLILNDRPHTE